jgi:hypothetical protein
MTRGVARERSLSFISATVLVDGLRRTPMEQFVIWTGESMHGWATSRTGRALSCVAEAGVPISLRTLVQRAARIEGEHGLSPDAVRNAVRQHQAAQPAVLLLVERRPCGDFVAVTDIPFAGVRLQRVREGDVVMTAKQAAMARAGMAGRGPLPANEPLHGAACA